MRFFPRPCAEFPNDNPDIHDGAVWVCTWSRARPRALMSAQGLARQRSATPGFEHQPRAAAELPSSGPTDRLSVPPDVEEASVEARDAGADESGYDPFENEATPASVDDGAGTSATEIQHEAADAVKSDAPPDSGGLDVPELPLSEEVVSSEQIREPDAFLAASHFTDEPQEPSATDPVEPPPTSLPYVADLITSDPPEVTPVPPTANSRVAEVGVQGDRRESKPASSIPVVTPTWSLDPPSAGASEPSPVGEPPPSPPAPISAQLTLAALTDEVGERQLSMFDDVSTARATSSKPELSVAGTESPARAAVDVDEQAVAGAALEHLDDVFAAEDFSQQPPAVAEGSDDSHCDVESTSNEELDTSEPEPSLDLSALDSLGALFDQEPSAWQTPTDGLVVEATPAPNAVGSHGLSDTAAAASVAPEDAEDADSAPVSPASVSGHFKVPRPERLGIVVDEKPTALGEPDVEPLSLDLTPPPPGAAGWDQLVAFLSDFMAQRGATRAAALAPGLLEGRRVSLDRLPQPVKQELCDAEIAEATAGGFWPTPEFRQEASAFHLDYTKGSAPPQDLLRWLAPVVRALLHSSVSTAAMRAHLESAGIVKLLKNAA